MSFILGLHGVVAVVLLCGLLFAEEAGVPLPTPGELTLIAAGLLIVTGGLDPWLFVPAAIVACLAGSATGYSWARLIGEHGLSRLADRLGQRQRLARVSAGLREAGPREIALSRLVPGLRVYTTLVSGAVGVHRRAFFTGVVPATVVWVCLFTLLGAVAGVPAERLFTSVEQLVVQGGVLIAVGVGGYLAIRHLPDAGRDATVRLPPPVRMGLAIAIDMALLGSVVAGVLAVARPLVGWADINGWVDILIVIAVIGVFFSVATRQGAHATAGETLFGTSYLTRAGDRHDGGAGVRRLVRTLLRDVPAGSSPALQRASELFRVLADERRLRIARLLLERERTATALGLALDQPRLEIVYQLGELQRAGIVEQEAGVDEPRYAIRSANARAGLAELLVHASRPPPSAAG